MTQEKKQVLSKPSTGQAEKFKAMAKELETENDPKSFDAKLKTLAKGREKPAKGK